MVLTSFMWPHGGRQVFLSDSFTGWARPYPMTLVEGSLTVFHVWVDLPEGYHEYRFLVDGIWLYDNQQAYAADASGTVNNIIHIGTTDVSSQLVQEPYIYRTMRSNDCITMQAASPSSHMLTPEPLPHISDADVEASRHWVSEILSSRTAYDMLPTSSKISVIDVELPVKQAFNIMYEEGLVVVPLWDNHRACVTGILTASDFILILRELQNSVPMVADGELEMHTVSAWKEGKLQPRSNGPIGMHIRPLIRVSDHESLKDVALKIVQNEISAVPVFKSSQDGSCMPLLNLACLPGILKYICRHFRETIRSMPLLKQAIYRLPLGTWLPEAGRGSQRSLATLPHNASLSSALGLLMEARISSVPIVDDNGSLIDVYSRSDIIALAKDDMYARIQLDRMTMDQALNQVYQANLLNNGRRQYHTCFRASTLHEVMERLSDPGVRRLVIIDPRSRRVEGLITLRDVFIFLLGP